MTDLRKYEFVREDGTAGVATLPSPVGWKVLVRPRQAKKVSAGGIVLAQETRDAEEAMVYIGQVLALGEAAFTATTQGGIDMSGFEVKPKVGDWVLYATFAGQKFKVKGDDSVILLLNDTEIQAVVENPDDYYAWVDA